MSKKNSVEVAIITHGSAKRHQRRGCAASGAWVSSTAETAFRVQARLAAATAV
jgi:hypothetical protein